LFLNLTRHLKNLKQELKEYINQDAMKKIELEIVAISHSITQSHSYAVVLGEVGGVRRLPIVIGGFEAQSIAVAMEKMNTGRPLTHDLFKQLCDNFNIDVTEVVINNLLEGIFYAKLICKRSNEVLEIDSRTSDAIAIAVRFNCPIYTYEFILDSAGILLEDTPQEGDQPELKTEKKSSSSETKVSKGEDLTKYTLQELQDKLKSLVTNEEYDKAIPIRDEINRRKKNS